MKVLYCHHNLDIDRILNQLTMTLTALNTNSIGIRKRDDQTELTN